MTITQLKYIITLEKTRNFTKAAYICNISQPTLSMQIQKLEEELKVKIFDRTKKPIELSVRGVNGFGSTRKHIVCVKALPTINTIQIWTFTRCWSDDN